MTELQTSTLKDAIGVLKEALDIAYECSNPANKDANVWCEVLQKLYEAKTFIEDAIDHE